MNVNYTFISCEGRKCQNQLIAQPSSIEAFIISVPTPTSLKPLLITMPPSRGVFCNPLILYLFQRFPTTFPSTQQPYKFLIYCQTAKPSRHPANLLLLLNFLSSRSALLNNPINNLQQIVKAPPTFIYPQNYFTTLFGRKP